MEDAKAQLLPRLAQQATLRTTPSETGLHIVGVDGNVLLEKDPNTGLIQPLTIPWTAVHGFKTAAEVEGKQRQGSQRKEDSNRASEAKRLRKAFGADKSAAKANQ